ncbi:alanine/ornithine racemase family PLP-dependent enzyme [Crocinitomicaceae bacterium]|nr:alanine/ornithine racemase family PLP-dependent enzyme [Crocinitomicaceae bacterium]
MSTPRLEIDLTKIESNILELIRLFGEKKVSVFAVTKVVCGNLDIAHLLVRSGVKVIADSKLENLRAMRQGKVRAELLLLGPPKMSEVKAVVQYSDMSLNTEITIIKRLSRFALKLGVNHKIVLMVECGDLREGILPENLLKFVSEVLPLKGVTLIGIGTNLGCFGGVHPDQENMELLSTKASQIESEFGIQLSIISGGNSANYLWFINETDIGRVNNLRLGESIFLGRETTEQKRIPGLFVDAFTLVAEVTELKLKPISPNGKIIPNGYRDPVFHGETGEMHRAILGMGKQDVIISGLTPIKRMNVIGGSSDHTIINQNEEALQVGSEVRFNLNYAALLSAMTSPYVQKTILPTK